MNTRIEYLPHIDGLRALAVLVVILLHIDVAGFYGGYVGVDIFFVISGYLITLLLKKELEETGELKLSKFYLRRVRRLAPAFFIVCAFSFIASILIFSPQHLESFGASLIHAITSLSNFYFWTDSGYFDLSNEVKPLLHTWSLSVEEQFYLLWPLFILLLYRTFWNKVFYIFAIIGILSFLLNHLFVDGYSLLVKPLPETIKELFRDGGASIYYLTPFRVFEFVIGALAIKLNRINISKTIHDALTILGLFLIFYCVFTFNENTIFPYYNALLPCLGTALVINSGGSSRLRIIFTNRPVVWIGLLSYSLYLVHWPVIVFYKYLVRRELTVVDKIYIIFITLLLSAWIYRYVEVRFRRPNESSQNINFFFAGIVSVILLIVPAANIWANGGWVWRLDKSSASLFDDFGDYNEFVDKYAGGANCPYTFSDQLGPICETDSRAKKHIWIVGDSHGRHLTEGLTNRFGGVNFKFIKNNCRLNTLELCYPVEEELREIYFDRRANILDTLKSDDSPIIIAQTWIIRTLRYVDRSNKVIAEFDENNPESVIKYSQFVISEIYKLASYLKSNNPGRRIIVVGDVTRSGLPDGVSPLDCISSPFDLFSRDCKERIIDKNYSRKLFNDELAREFSKTTLESILFIDPFKATCNESSCINYLENGYPVYMDSSHLSSWGSKFVVEKLYSDFRYAFRDYIEERNYYAN